MRNHNGLSRRGFIQLAGAIPALAVVGQAEAAASPAVVHRSNVFGHGWRNVEIAGGGFVPGIVFNRSEPGLVYARTDIGGAYRRDSATRQWKPLLDWVGQDNWGYNGVVSVATDPVDPDRVYVAAGMYTNNWDPNNGAVLRSRDRGETWQVAELPFKLGGNMPGRGMGERLAVDPGDNRILYLGAPSGNGLWRSTDSGRAWSKVESFPNPGDYVVDPSDPSGYNADIQGVVWVTFDEASSTRGAATRTIYVGVADKENTVYVSTDAGATWKRIAGQPTGYIAHKGVLDSANGYLYLATSDTGGPYDGGKGDVWKFHTREDRWTKISPIAADSPDCYFGYSGLTIDRRNPDTLMVATQISWWPDVIFFRSTDGGQSWRRIWDWAGYPNRELHYTMDVSSAPWLTFGNKSVPPSSSPKLGWMTESLEIDPFDSDRMMYGTGATVYGTGNLTEWDRGGKIAIEPMVAGLEETAVLDLISPPEGAPLLSALGDIGGFRHEQLDRVPELMFQTPAFTTTRSLDFAESRPGTIVRVGDTDDGSRFAVSQDGGRTWFAGSEPPGVTGGGTTAVAADGARFVWSPQGSDVHHSSDDGRTWQRSSGIPAGARIRSDRVEPRVFYGLSGGTFYISTDGGSSFADTRATGLPPGTGYFQAATGRAGDIWLTGEGGLWHSTDAGSSFRKIDGVRNSRNIGFGKAAPGRDYPALFAIATVDDVYGVFHSDDAGVSWLRINDDRHQYGNIGDAITGDPRVYGRVYLGTNGRGVVYAQSPCQGTGS